MVQGMLVHHGGKAEWSGPLTLRDEDLREALAHHDSRPGTKSEAVTGGMRNFQSLNSSGLCLPARALPKCSVTLQNSHQYEVVGSF